MMVAAAAGLEPASPRYRGALVGTTAEGRGLVTRTRLQRRRLDHVHGGGAPLAVGPYPARAPERAPEELRGAGLGTRGLSAARTAALAQAVVYHYLQGLRLMAAPRPCLGGSFIGRQLSSYRTIHCVCHTTDTTDALEPFGFVFFSTGETEGALGTFLFSTGGKECSHAMKTRFCHAGGGRGGGSNDVSIKSNREPLAKFLLACKQFY